ncbi:hypothetical protein C8R43DRAFT_1105729 [Mycena crocata]|nr:hypothetical protein C8R43DRAFT_1105729 [Mycena crocata]
MTPASTRIAPGLVMFNNVTSADQICRVMKASFFNLPFIRVLQIRFKFNFNFKPQMAFKLHPASNCGTSLSSHIVNPSSLQSLTSSSSLFAFHSTQLLNTEWTSCSSLIHATQRLKMIVPSVHTFAGFKLLSFKNAQFVLTLTHQHSLLQFPGLSFVFRAGVGHLSPLRDHRIHDVSSSRERAELTGIQNPPEANDALLKLATHRVHLRVVGFGSAVLKHDVSSSREQAEPAGPGKVCRVLTLRQTCNDQSTVSNFNNPNPDSARSCPRFRCRGRNSVNARGDSSMSVSLLQSDSVPGAPPMDSIRLANRLNSAYAGMRLRLGWNVSRYAIRSERTALPASDANDAAAGAELTARIASGRVRSPPWRTRDSSDGSVLRAACYVRPLLAYAIRRPGRAANRVVWGVFQLRVTRFVTDSPRLDVHATPTCDSTPTTRLEHGAATRDSAWEAFEAAAGIDSLLDRQSTRLVIPRASPAPLVPFDARGGALVRVDSFGTRPNSPPKPPLVSTWNALPAQAAHAQHTANAPVNRVSGTEGAQMTHLGRVVRVRYVVKGMRRSVRGRRHGYRCERAADNDGGDWLVVAGGHVADEGVGVGSSKDVPPVAGRAVGGADR